MKETFLMQHPCVLSIELTLATPVPMGMAKLSNSFNPCSRTMMLHMASEGITTYDEALQSIGQHATTFFADFTGQLYLHAESQCHKGRALTQIQLLCLHSALGTVIMQHRPIRPFLNRNGAMHFRFCLTALQVLLKSSLY